MAIQPSAGLDEGGRSQVDISVSPSTSSPLNVRRWRLSDVTTPQDDLDKLIHLFLAIARPQHTGLILEPPSSPLVTEPCRGS